MFLNVAKYEQPKSLLALCLLWWLSCANATKVDVLFECDFDSGSDCGAQYDSDLDDFVMSVVQTSQVIDKSSSNYTITDVSSITKATSNGHYCQYPFIYQGIQYDHCTDTNKCAIDQNGNLDDCAMGHFLSAKIVSPWENQYVAANFPVVNIPEDGEYIVEYFVFIYCDELDQAQCQSQTTDVIDVKLENNDQEETKHHSEKYRNWTRHSHTIDLSQGTLNIAVKFIRPDPNQQTVVQFGFDNLRVYKEKLDQTIGTSESTIQGHVSSSSSIEPTNTTSSEQSSTGNSQEPVGSTTTADLNLSTWSGSSNDPVTSTSGSTESSTREYTDQSTSYVSRSSNEPASSSAGGSVSRSSVEPTSWSSGSSEGSVPQSSSDQPTSTSFPTSGSDKPMSSSQGNSGQPTSYSTSTSESSTISGSVKPTSTLSPTGSSNEPVSSSISTPTTKTTGGSSYTTAHGQTDPSLSNTSPKSTTTAAVNPVTVSNKSSESTDIVLIIILATVIPLGTLTLIVVVVIIFTRKKRFQAPEMFSLN